jgi:hypothetical protein
VEAETASPCLRAFTRERCLPSFDLGPVLCRALSRLAANFCDDGIGQDPYTLRRGRLANINDILRRRPQPPSEGITPTVKLIQSAVAAGIRSRNQAIDPLDVVQLFRKRAGSGNLDSGISGVSA